MHKRFAQSIPFFSILLAAPLMGVWLDRKAEGWAWYEEAPPEIKSESENGLEDRPPPSFSYTDQAAEIRQKLEEILSKAILEPTEKNIEHYIQEQMKWINQSAQFSKVWTKVLLHRPDLDASTEFPVSQYGIQLYKQIQHDQLFALMHALIPHYGLFFFYEGKDQRSQTFSMVVQEFARKYGWEVIAISKDGYLLDGFADNHADNGAAQKIGVEIFPSLFLVDPHTADIRPIAFGLVSIDRIENNIALQFPEWKENQ